MILPVEVSIGILRNAHEARTFAMKAETEKKRQKARKKNLRAIYGIEYFDEILYL